MCSTAVGSATVVDFMDSSDLAMGAARAAMELDQLLLGRETSLEAAMRVTEYLGRAIKTGPGEVPSASVDYSALVVLGRAMQDSRFFTSPARVEDLVSEAAQVVGGIREIHKTASSGGHGEEETVGILRDFFVALSRASMAAEEPITSRSPARPYRT